MTSTERSGRSTQARQSYVGPSSCSTGRAGSALLTLLSASSPISPAPLTSLYISTPAPTLSIYHIYHLLLSRPPRPSVSPSSNILASQPPPCTPLHHLTVRDVSPDAFIAAYSSHLKRSGELSSPCRHRRGFRTAGRAPRGTGAGSDRAQGGTRLHSTTR